MNLFAIGVAVFFIFIGFRTLKEIKTEKLPEGGRLVVKLVAYGAIAAGFLGLKALLFR